MRRVYVGVGSNTGREQNVGSAVKELNRLFGELTISSVYESDAVGNARGRFYNLVVGFNTSMRIEKLLKQLHQIETRCGRVRNVQSGGLFPLDLDLLLYGDFVGKVLDLHLPRSDVKRFAFVLCPLAEIAGMRRHPESGEPFQVMWDEFDQSSQPLARVDVPLSTLRTQSRFSPVPNFRLTLGGFAESTG